MNSNVLFVHKRTNAIEIVALTATTQAEFNAQMQAAYSEVAARWHQFSYETETFDGDEALLQQWTENFEPVEGMFDEITAEGEPLKNDHLQFARLLHELDVAAALTPGVVAQLAANMDCEESFIKQVLERATCAFDEYIGRETR